MAFILSMLGFILGVIIGLLLINLASLLPEPYDFIVILILFISTGILLVSLIIIS